MNTLHSPRRRGFSPSRATRAAYTLMEMITVQAVLVGLVAMSWPALRGSMHKNELVDAARCVRTELLKARQATMESGVAHQFRYQADGSRFEIVAVESAKKAGSAAGRKAAAPVNQPSDAEQEVKSRTLPGDVTFVTCAEKTPAASIEPAELRQAAAADDAEWSAPICFYPNGRSSSARIRLHGRDGHFVELSLRGITGTVALGEVKHEVAEVDAAEVR